MADLLGMTELAAYQDEILGLLKEKGRAETVKIIEGKWQCKKNAAGNYISKLEDKGLWTNPKKQSRGTKTVGERRKKEASADVAELKRQLELALQGKAEAEAKAKAAEEKAESNKTAGQRLREVEGEITAMKSRHEKELGELLDRKRDLAKAARDENEATLKILGKQSEPSPTTENDNEARPKAAGAKR